MQNEEYNPEIEESKRKLTLMFNLILSKEDVSNVSKLKRYFYYFIISIMIFVVIIFLLIKNILLLQFTSIPSLFYSVRITDGLIKDYLEI
jgi:hypothetical protein